MLKKLRSLLLVFAALASTSLCSAAALAQTPGTVTVRVSPAKIQVAPGEIGEAAVEVVDVDGLYGFDVLLTFEPQVVEVVDADPDQDGVQVAFGTFLDPGFVVQNVVDNGEGTIRFAMTQLNPSEAKSGTGPLIVIQLRVEQAGGTTQLTLTDGQLARRDGTKLATTLVSAQVDVTASSMGQPTSTPIPTQDPSALVTPPPTASAGEELPSPSPDPAVETAGATETNSSSSATPTPEGATPATSPTASLSPPTPTSVPPTVGTRQATPTSTATPRDDPATSTPVVAAAVASETPAGEESPRAPTETPSGEARAPGQEGRTPWLLWLAVGLLACAAALFFLAVALTRRDQTPK